jgi:predicted nucleic acid-binding protein
MNAVDTNVLIYVHDPRDPGKQATAEALVASLIDGVLLWQVACEFIAASRKLGSYGFSREEAWLEIHRLQQIWTTKLPSWVVIQKAEDLQTSYSLSFGTR